MGTRDVDATNVLRVARCHLHDFGPDGDQRRGSSDTFELSAMLGLELFLSRLGFDNLSLGAGHGLALTHRNPAGSGDDTTTFETRLAEVDVVRSSILGFHYYF